MQPDPRIRSTSEAAESLQALLDHGFQPPSWAELRAGARPEQEHDVELGEFLRGWQRCASAPLEQHQRETLTSALDEPSQALLLSQSGSYAGRVFTALPNSPDYRIRDDLFRVLLLRRLRLPLPLTATRCSCRHLFDSLGDHRATCAVNGVLGPRGAVLERAVARMCREAGANVGWNVLLRELNLDEPVQDERRIEIVANGLPIWHGSQVAVDTTLVSALRRDGTARPNAHDTPGIALAAIRRRKRRRYHEIIRADRCRLVVFGLEVGGRWSDEALELLRKLARARSRSEPIWLRQAAAQSWAHRWSATISVAAQRAFAASLLHLPLAPYLGVDGDAPSTTEVCEEARWLEAPPASRVAQTRNLHYSHQIRRCILVTLVGFSTCAGEPTL